MGSGPTTHDGSSVAVQHQIKTLLFSLMQVAVSFSEGAMRDRSSHGVGWDALLGNIGRSVRTGIKAQLMRWPSIHIFHRTHHQPACEHEKF